jgi:peptide/nickel transport system permease protein
VGLALLSVLAPFVAPYLPRSQQREFFYAPPTTLHFVDEQGDYSLRPFVLDYIRVGGRPQYEKTGRKHYLRFFVEGETYTFLGWRLSLHLFGIEDPDRKVFLLGSDALGRDIFSRLVYGCRFSSAIGLFGVLLTMSLGVSLGALAGYTSGWVDRAIMRGCDLFLSLPGLFLVLGLRAVLPLEMSGSAAFWMIVLSFSIIGWGVVTRVVRGQVLSLKERHHVLAARAAGASSWRILTRHILPFTSNYLLVQCTVFFPLFILGEITLSFLGIGVQEPDVSLGSLLRQANSLQIIIQYPWFLSPALVIFVTVFSFNLLSDELKVLGKERTQWW